MLEETAGQSELLSDDDSGSKSGGGSQHRTSVLADEKAASEQAARDGEVRARNKRVPVIVLSGSIPSELPAEAQPDA